MAIITLTQTLGTRGDELGRLTADRLGYRFITAAQLIEETSKEYQVTPEQLAIVNERRPHFWERLKTDTESFIAYFRAVVLREMARDKLIVTGRSVAHILPEFGCGLRVRLVGPIKERAEVVGADENLALVVAERRVRDYDREVRARIQTLFDVDIEDPVSFHLTLNTFAWPLEMLAEGLAFSAGQIEQKIGPQQWCLMRDAALAAEVRAALRLHPKIGHAPFDVQCASGIVRVNGPGLVPPWDELVNKVVRQVKGVEAVNVVAEEQPTPVRPA